MGGGGEGGRGYRGKPAVTEGKVLGERNQRGQSVRRETLHDAMRVLRIAGLAFITLNKSAHGRVLCYWGLRIHVELRECVQHRVTGIGREVPGIARVTGDLRGSAL